MSEQWLELTFTQKSSGLAGTKQNKTIEFWDINNLIYTIEKKLPSLKHPIHNIALRYLAEGSDFTEKCYNKSHATFLKTFLKQVEYVKDLVKECDYTLLNSHTYRKLIHAIQLGLKQDSEQTTFHQLREAIKIKADVLMHLPQEKIMYQRFRRVSRVYCYMLSYVVDIGVIDWGKYGFHWDEETQSLKPVIEVQSTENGNSNTLINIASTKANRTRPECHIEHLENIFEKQSHISRKKSMMLLRLQDQQENK